MSAATMGTNGCEMRTIKREGRGEEMLLPRVDGEWTEDLSRKVRYPYYGICRAHTSQDWAMLTDQ